MTLKLFLGSAAAAALVCVVAGCERSTVYSKAPLFNEADAVGAPQPAPGLWLREWAEDEPCAFDPKAATEKWPGCAEWFVVQDGLWTQFYSPDEGKLRVEKWQALVISNSPLILQRGQRIDGYQYSIVVGPARDGNGSLVSFETLHLPCKSGVQTGPGSEAEVRRDCLLDSRDQVLIAAAEEAGRLIEIAHTEAEPPSVARLRWVRDARHDDIDRTAALRRFARLRAEFAAENAPDGGMGRSP